MRSIPMSDLAEGAQKRAMAMMEDRPVYARASLRGHRLVQIHFFSTNSAEYEKQEQALADDGWRQVDFTA